MMAVLTLATLILFLMMRTHMIVSRTESWVLLLIYGVFVGWVAVETFNVTNLLVNFPPGS